MQPIAGEPIMERPASRGRLGDRGRLDASDDDEDVSRAESFHSRRSHTTTGGTGHSRLAYFKKIVASPSISLSVHRPIP